MGSFECPCAEAIVLVICDVCKVLLLMIYNPWGGCRIVALTKLFKWNSIDKETCYGVRSLLVNCNEEVRALISERGKFFLLLHNDSLTTKGYSLSNLLWI